MLYRYKRRGDEKEREKVSSAHLGDAVCVSASSPPVVVVVMVIFVGVSLAQLKLLMERFKVCKHMKYTPL